LDKPLVNRTEVRYCQSKPPVGSYLILPLLPKSDDINNSFSLTRTLPLRILPALWTDDTEQLGLRSGALLSASEFQQVHQRFGAWILTNEPKRIRCLLHLADDDSSIKTEWI
jgi:hypothetical protein